MVVHSGASVYEAYARDGDILRKHAVFIIGFPRTATTGLYQEICVRTHSSMATMGYSSPVCIHEPFNPAVVEDILKKGVHRHDRVGEVINTYDLLPPEILENIKRNMHWLEGFMKHGEPYMGRNWRNILDELLGFAEKNNMLLIIKDVYAWPRLGELVRLYRGHAVFIAPLRNRFFVLRSFRRWYEKRISVRLFRRVNPRKLLSVRRIIRYIRYYTRSRRVIRADHMFGLAHFYRFFYGRVLDSRIPPHVLLELYLHSTYSIYEGLCRMFASYRVVGTGKTYKAKNTWGVHLGADVICPVFEDRLSDEQLRAVEQLVMKHVLGS